MMYRIEFVLSGLPPTTNGSHGHFRAKAAEKKKWRMASRLAARAQGAPIAPLKLAGVVVTRFSSGRTDFDNRVISAKPIIDGLKDAGIILDDSDDVLLERKYLMEKTAPGKGFIKVCVYEL